MKKVLMWALAALALASSAAYGQTVLWFQSDAGDYIGQGLTQSYPAPTYPMTVSRNSAQGISVAVGGWNIDFTTGSNAAMAPGAYESASRYPFNGSSPGLSFSGNGRGCNTLTGRFVVLQLVVNGIGVVQSFAVNFEQHCEGGTPALWGELRYNSTLPLTIGKPPGSTSPDAMRLLPRTLVPVGSEVISNLTTVYGINSPAAISISGGTYSVNGGPFVPGPGSVSNRDHVRVRVLASPNAGETVTATLTVDTQNIPFQVTTYNAGAPITALYFESYGNDWIGQGQTLYAHQPDWSFSFTPSGTDQVTVNMNGPAGATWNLSLAGPLGAPLDPGAFEQAVRAPFRGSSPGLDFNGSGRGCNQLIGRFSVLQADYSNPFSPRFAANFEQWCDSNSGPLLGEIRINSTVPLGIFASGQDGMPDPMALWAQLPVKAGSTVYSNWTRVNDVNVAVPISIEGPGLYSINNGPPTSSPGTAQDLDMLYASLVAPDTPGATAQATLQVGGRSAPFTVTTYQPGQALTGFYFRSANGDYLGQGNTEFYLAPYNRWEYSGGYWELTGFGGSNWRVRMTAPGGAAPAPGVYENSTSSGGPSNPTLNMFGNGRGCGQAAGSFTVREAVYSPDSTPQTFAADFVLRCENTMPPLLGEIRFNSTVPFSALLVAPVAVKSRKDHAGTARDLVIDRSVGIQGAVSVEPRAIGAGHLLVFEFDGPITSPGVAACVDAVGAPLGTISSVAVNPSNNREVIVTLTAIPDNQRAQVSLANVNGYGVNASASLAFLVGDVNGSRSVTASDILRIKGRQGPVTNSTFPYDVDLSGGVSPGDIDEAKARSGLAS